MLRARIIPLIMSIMMVLSFMMFFETAEVKAETLSDIENEIAVLVNEERTSRGLEPLKVSPILVMNAETRAKELPVYFSHTRPDGTRWDTAISESVMDVTFTWGENIAYGARSAEQVVELWMNSEGHRANILSENYTHIGVGVYKDLGVYFFSQIFIGTRATVGGEYLPQSEKLPVTSIPQVASGPRQRFNEGYGDVNSDNSTDSRDATIILIDYASVLIGNRSSITGSSGLGDVNGDSAVDSRDATVILCLYAEKLNA